MTREEATTAVIKNLLLNEHTAWHIGFEITEGPYAHFEAWGKWEGARMIIEYEPRTWTR